MTDRFRIVQVLSNLLTNAGRHSPDLSTLVARVRAVLRRQERPEPEAPYVLGDLDVNYGDRTGEAGVGRVADRCGGVRSADR